MLGSGVLDGWLDAPLSFRVLTVAVVVGVPTVWRVMGRRAASVQRLKADARPVPLAMIGSCLGEVVETAGLIVPGPAGLVRSPVRQEEGVYARRSVSVWTSTRPVALGQQVGPMMPQRQWVRSSQDVDHVPERRACFGIQDGTTTVWTEADDWDDLPGDVVDSATMQLDSVVGDQREQRVVELVVRAGTRVSVRGKVERRGDGTVWLVPYSGQRLVQPDRERERDDRMAALRERAPTGPFDALRRLAAARGRPRS